jgi:hypothetical protein
MLRTRWTLAAALLICSSSHASNCDAIRSQIEAKIRSGGVHSFTLTTVDAASNAPGRVVGQCSQGSRKIVYVAGATAAGTPAAARPAGKGNEALLTECKDGSMSVGGNCGK